MCLTSGPLLSPAAHPPHRHWDHGRTLLLCFSWWSILWHALLAWKLWVSPLSLLETPCSQHPSLGLPPYFSGLTTGPASLTLPQASKTDLLTQGTIFKVSGPFSQRRQQPGLGILGLSPSASNDATSHVTSSKVLSPISRLVYILQMD